jgi:hypothetical protein
MKNNEIIENHTLGSCLKWSRWGKRLKREQRAEEMKCLGVIEGHDNKNDGWLGSAMTCHGSSDLLVTARLWAGGGGIALVRVDTEKMNEEGKREKRGGERADPSPGMVQVQVMEQMPSVGMEDSLAGHY